MKKFILSIFILLSTNLYAQCQGDVNEDGTVNVVDIVNTVNIIFSGETDCEEDSGDDIICGDEVELFGQTYSVENTYYLDLEHLQIQGVIPPEIGCFVNLLELDLEDNQISGEIPPELGSLTNLHYLDLEKNQLTGDVPDSVKELILNINSIGGYTSLILNGLNDMEWININACGDCNFFCSELIGEWEGYVNSITTCNGIIQEENGGPEDTVFWIFTEDDSDQNSLFTQFYPPEGPSYNDCFNCEANNNSFEMIPSCGYGGGSISFEYTFIENSLIISQNQDTFDDCIYTTIYYLTEIE